MSRQKLKAIKLIVKNFLFHQVNTYCHLLWNSVFIDQHGNIYICCHNEPGIIGNIYKSTLQDIWTKNIKLKIFRRMSLNKCLPCCFECNILSNKEKERIFQYPVPTDHPKRVWVLYGEFCNLRCIMCWQDHKSRITLDNDILKTNIDWVHVKEIVLQGGEILAIESAKKFYLWLTNDMDKKVNLVTNGVLISDEWAEHLVKGSEWVEISVNAATKETHELINRGSNYSKVIENIKKLIYLKHQYKSEVEIIYKYTIVPENILEIAEAIEFADTLGCDKIVYGYDFSVPFTLNKNNHLREQIRNKLDKVINHNRLKIRIERERLSPLGLLADNDDDDKESILKPLD